MYGMSLLHNYDRYDENSFTGRQRIVDYILFSSQMYKETRMIFVATIPCTCIVLCIGSMAK